MRSVGHLQNVDNIVNMGSSPSRNLILIAAVEHLMAGHGVSAILLLSARAVLLSRTNKTCNTNDLSLNLDHQFNGALS